jgi:threonine/homoserine/homoserine lactone efflux protein
MIATQGLVTFVIAGVLLNLTPGPDVLYVVARSASQGRAAGMVSALGIGAGCLLHIVAAVVGLSALMTKMPVAQDVVRGGGAAYLVYLGVRALMSAEKPADVAEITPASLGRLFWQGALTNAMNPKVGLFFIAFLPQFVDPARGSLPIQFLVLGLIFNVNGTLVNLAYALVASRFGGWLRSRFRVSRVLNRISGGIFIALGARLALAGRR